MSLETRCLRTNPNRRAVVMAVVVAVVVAAMVSKAHQLHQGMEGAHPLAYSSQDTATRLPGDDAVRVLTKPLCGLAC